MIDIHFNAGPPTATGTEVIIKGNPNKFERKIAGKIVEVMSEKLEIRNRGVKTESSTARGRIGILHVPCNTILLELCFLTNTNDMDNYTKWKFILASAIADIIKKI
jgi:N-acetylmuramoyl-L-alanine amidase